MKQYFLQHILLCLCLLAGTQITFAYDAQIDGIYYNFSGNTATVTYQKNEDWNYISDYSGDVVIPESVTYNGRTYSVTTIGYSAFSGCSGLTSVTIPNSVTSIGMSAFWYCSSLTSVTIPESVKSIGTSAFYGCSGLTSVTIPNSVTNIGSNAFRYCSSLTSITIPESVTSIGYSAFGGCSNIASLCIDCDSIGGWFSDSRKSLQTLTLGDHVRIIGPSAFAWCSGLTSITIPESVTSIGRSAFAECSSLTSVTIPESVTSIGFHAFAECSGLKEVYCLAEDFPQTDDYVFDWSPIESATLYVPEGSVEAYRTTEPWSGFGTIVGLTQDMIDGVESLTSALPEGEDAWYDLQGRRVAEGRLTKGNIYVRGGKKVLVRW